MPDKIVYVGNNRRGLLGKAIAALILDDLADIDPEEIIKGAAKMEKKTKSTTVAHYPSYSLGTFKTRKLPGRNEPCPCLSGKKFKACCLNKIEAPLREKVVEASKKTVEEGK